MPLVNVADQVNGGVATASSTANMSYPPAGANNGDRRGLNWGNGGGWNDGTVNVFPDWLQVTFKGTYTVSEIDVFCLQDSYPVPGVDPTPTMTFSLYGITDFQAQYWNGSAWVDVPGGNITGNNLVWRRIVFTPVSTDRVRVLVNASVYQSSIIIELEAWASDYVPPAPPPPVPGTKADGVWNFITDCGADPTGIMDASAILQGALQTIADAGGGTLFCPPGIYLLSRGLQDTSITNAQVKLPKIGTGELWASTAQVGIHIEGALPAPTSGASSVMPAAGYTIFKSTLTGATGVRPSVIGHPFVGDGIGLTNQNNLATTWKNLIFQLPPNPSMACLNLGNGQDPHIDGVLIHTGALRQLDVVQPTNPDAVGIIMNKNYMANMASIRNTIVWGMYAGYEISELMITGNMVSWSCWCGLRVNWGYHANQIQFLGTYECAIDIFSVSDGHDKYLEISLWDTENSNGTYQSWQNNVSNIDDGGNTLHGNAKWHAVNVGGGVTHSLVKAGAVNFTTNEL